MSRPPLTVLLVVEPGVDGVFRCVEVLARFLLERGVRVHLAYSSVRGSPALLRLVDELRAGGSRTLDLRVSNQPGPKDALAFLRLLRMARAVRPDVIHAHSSKAGALARPLRWCGIEARLLYTPHAYFQMGQPLTAKGRFILAIERLLGHVGTTLNTSYSEAEYAREWVKLKLERQLVITNGVDCRRFLPATAAERDRLRAEIGLPEGALALGTVARYSPQKDPVTLYRAVLGAMERLPQLHFLHLGSGQLRPEVDQLLEGSPHRARIHQFEVMDPAHTFYQLLDGFILPSRYEGLALAALEALATGLPMILTSCPGNNDFKHYPLDQIRWAPPGDASQIASQILAWAGSRDTLSNHREVALSEFDARACCERILGCYAERGAPREKKTLSRS